MSEDGLHPLETILRLCAAAAPEPWYPRLFAKQAGVDPHALGRCLEELWLSGLIERADGGPDKGPAISLSREGQRVLLDPESLRRLRAGEPISANDRGAIVRQALRGPLRPHITVLLVLLNVLVFAAGYYRARLKGEDVSFLRGAPLTATVEELLEKSGALVPSDLLDGQWWRLLTAGFVHIGFLHLLMNMACLYLAGRFIEQLWGHLRYLVIYVIALLGGSCLVAAHPVLLSAGASGAVCGILAAEAVWFLFNRRYLPRALVRQARTNFLLNLVLLIFISSFKNVSGWGHFGGGAAGALAAMLLQLHRFGPPIWRWLAIAGFAPLAWYGLYVIEHARATDPRWHEVEKRVLKKHFADPVAQALAEANKVYVDTALPVLEKHPSRRDASKMEQVLPALAEQRDKLQALDDELARFGPLFNMDVEKIRQQYRKGIGGRLRLIEEAEQALRNGDKWQAPAEREQLDFETHYLRKTAMTLSAARTLYRQHLRPLLQAEPSRRDAAAVEKAQAALAEQRPQLMDLLEALKAAGPYDDDMAETARRTAHAYAAAYLELLDFAQSGLDAGAKWNDAQKQALKKRESQVDEYHLKWRNLVE